MNPETRERLLESGFSHEEINQIPHEYQLNVQDASNWLLDRQNLEVVNLEENNPNQEENKEIPQIIEPNQQANNNENLPNHQDNPPRNRDNLLALRFAQNKAYYARKILPARFRFREIWFDRYFEPDIREFPGLRNIEERKLHHRYFKCGLMKDPHNDHNKKSFSDFVKLLTKNPQIGPQYRMLVSFKYAYDKKCLYIVSHESESSGFGEVLKRNNCKIGIFKIKCKTLYGRIDIKTQKLKEKIRRKDREIEEKNKRIQELLGQN